MEREKLMRGDQLLMRLINSNVRPIEMYEPNSEGSEPKAEWIYNMNWYI